MRIIALLSFLLISLQSVSASGGALHSTQASVSQAEPAPGSASQVGGGRIRFAFLTDTHYAVGAQSVADLRACVNDVNSIDTLDFVLIGGDLTESGADDELAGVKALLDSLKYKYYVVAGNHDATWSESGCNTFLKVFGYEHFEFVCKGWRFIGCNCGPDMRMSPALIPQDAMVWLKGLKAGQKTIFVNHYPQDTSVLNYFDVTRELKRVGVQFEIGGHWHNNTAMNYDGLPGFLGRSSLSDDSRPGYSIVVIEGDKVTVSERTVFGTTTVQGEPWYEQTLSPVKDTVTYDADGLPSGYPWMRYDVNESYPQVSEVWRFSEPANIASGFARAGEKAYYATSSGVVNAISLKNGRKLWSKPFGAKIFSTPAVSGKYLVFGCTDGFVYALNRSSGRVIWKYRCAKSVLGSPVIKNGTVFIGASDGAFRALRLKDGEAVWTNNSIESFVECRPYVDDEQVVFGTWSRKLYSLDPATGRLQWTWTCERPGSKFSPAQCWPVKSDGRIFIAVPDRKLYVLDAATGKELFHLNGVARESVGITEDGSSVFTKSMYSHLIAISSKVSFDSGGAMPFSKAQWNVRTPAGYDISPTCLSEKNGVLLLPTDKGNILAFNASDGTFLWGHKFSIALVNPLDVWEKKGKMFILASAMDGNVVLLNY